MNLPITLDLALGLIFIYLILSLLASEIQELLTTIFQWRAEHLKKSIEILLAGDIKGAEEGRVIQLANQLYASPLIKNINQEAKGMFVTLPRRLTWSFGSMYRSMKNPRPGTSKNETIFGNYQNSGPSYIPAETFASTLLETLELPTLVQKLTEARLEKFKNHRLEEIQEILQQLPILYKEDEHAIPNPIAEEFAQLQTDFDKAVVNFNQGKASLNTSLRRMSESVDRYIETLQSELADNKLYSKGLKQLELFRRDIFDDREQAILIGGLRPNITEVAQAINRHSAVYQEIVAIHQDQDNPAFQRIDEMIKNLPEAVIESISILAKRGEAKMQRAEEGLNQLRQEIEVGFDRSMDRASGVYKRNAKGVAILIGFVIAVIANADTFHIISRLSKDSTLRATITQNAGAVVARNGNNSITNLTDLRDQANQALVDVSLPIGWTDANLNQQIGLLPKQSIRAEKIIHMLPGWIITSFALSMGATFWFDLLNKFINVRNAGKPPISTTSYPTVDPGKSDPSGGNPGTF